MKANNDRLIAVTRVRRLASLDEPLDEIARYTVRRRVQRRMRVVAVAPDLTNDNCSSAYKLVAVTPTSLDNKYLVSLGPISAVHAERPGQSFVILVRPPRVSCDAPPDIGIGRSRENVIAAAPMHLHTTRVEQSGS